MPSGYTAGILDGEIKDFKQFATLCMRAFGATIHMRDENLDKAFEPRVPSDYHTKQIEKANQLLQDAQNISDKEIVGRRKSELLESKKYHINAIVKAKENEKKLTDILEAAQAWEPPTSEHTDIKEFMIKQIKETMAFDASTSYHDKNLLSVEKELQNLNPAVIRAEMIAKAEEDLLYHTTELDAEIKRCNDSNTWVEVFLKSL